MSSDLKFDKKGLKQLERIANDLEEIKGNPRRTFYHGVLYGAGAFVGGVLAIVTLGWLLNIAGLIPGISEIARIVGYAVQSRGR